MHGYSENILNYSSNSPCKDLIMNALSRIQFLSHKGYVFYFSASHIATST